MVRMLQCATYAPQKHMPRMDFFLWGVFRYRRIELNVGSQIAVGNLRNNKKGNVSGMRVIQNIRRLRQMDYKMKVCHFYYPKANMCADALAKISFF